MLRAAWQADGDHYHNQVVYHEQQSDNQPEEGGDASGGDPNYSHPHDADYEQHREGLNQINQPQNTYEVPEIRVEDHDEQSVGSIENTQSTTQYREPIAIVDTILATGSFNWADDSDDMPEPTDVVLETNDMPEAVIVLKTEVMPEVDGLPKMSVCESEVACAMEGVPETNVAPPEPAVNTHRIPAVPKLEMLQKEKKTGITASTASDQAISTSLVDLTLTAD